MKLFIVALLAFGLTGLQDAPLPDVDVVFAAARDNLAKSAKVQDEFAYKERRTQLHTNPFGRLGTGDVVVSAFTPLRPGPGYTRLTLERDGKPVTDAKPVQINERRRRDRAQTPAALRDVLGTLAFAVDRRVVVDGRPAILVTFTPKPNARPATREGRMARAFNGTIWIDEEAQEVTRIEAVAVDSISYGYGIVARLGEGTVVTLVREPIEDGIWLPTSIRFKGEGRAMLVRKFTIDFAIDWFDYRRLR